jgi:hypothetical protein
MNITVQSCRTAKKLLIEQCVAILAKELNIADRKFDVRVNVREGLIKSHNCDGLAQLTSPKLYDVFVDSRLKTDRLLSVLAHEMVHVKQMVLGQYWYFVDDYGHPTHFWLGEERTEHYYERPWELEAWAKERLLSIKLERIIYGHDV